RQAKESDGQIVERKKRKVNNKYVPKKEYGAETTHTPYAQPPHEYSPKTDRKEGKNKKLKSPVTGEKEEKGAAKAGGADHAYAQSQSYKKKQKQEEKKAKPPNKKKEEAPEEEEEESLVGTNEQNSEFTQGGPQFRSTWDVRRRRRSPTTA
uniref:LARP7 n=1 Tax=Globodera pallida TaxID=36090 RepID=A0A183CS03_GLOPA